MRERLERELARRCASNDQYSLRAFARQLDIDHSTLSQLLRGKRPFTKARVRSLGTAMGLSSDEIETMIAREADPTLQADEDATTRRKRELHHDAAVVLADGGIAFAMLELLRLDDFRADTGWVARVLGVTPDVVNITLQRLILLGLLEMRGGRWVDLCGDATATFEDFTAETLRRLIEQSEALASDAVARGRYEHHSTTLAIDTAALPRLREIVDRFRREIAACVEASDRRDAVYRLDVSLYPLTRPESEGDRTP